MTDIRAHTQRRQTEGSEDKNWKQLRYSARHKQHKLDVFSIFWWAGFTNNWRILHLKETGNKKQQTFLTNKTSFTLNGEYFLLSIHTLLYIAKSGNEIGAHKVEWETFYRNLSFHIIGPTLKTEYTCILIYISCLCYCTQYIKYIFQNYGMQNFKINICPPM